MQPIDYMTQVRQPFQAALQGYAQGAAIRDDQQQQAALALQAQQQQQALLAQQQMLAEVDAISRNPAATAKDYAALTMRYPQLREQAKQAWEMVGNERRAGVQEMLTRAYAATSSGRPDIAQNILRERATAMRNSGDEAGAKQMEQSAELIGQDPVQARYQIGTFLAGIMDPDKFAETFSKLGGEARAQELQPAAVQRGVADASKAQSDALKAATEAKFAESKAVADLKLSAAQVEKFAADTEIARMNSRIAAMNAQTAREGNTLKLKELQLKIEEAQQKRDDKVREKVGDYQAAQATLADAMGLIGEIRANKLGLQGATGATSWGAFMPGTPARTVAGKIEQLQNTLAAANLDKLKGAMSDKDILFLKNIATNLDRGQSEAAFVAELEKIEGTLIRNEKLLRQKFGGAAPLVPAADSPATPGAAGQRNIVVDW